MSMGIWLGARKGPFLFGPNRMTYLCKAGVVSC